MSSNPMIKSGIIENAIPDEHPMTAQGAVTKTLILSLILLFGAWGGWYLSAEGFTDKAYLISFSSILFAFILALATSFKPACSPVAAPFYALFEGLALGSLSYIYNSLYDGIVSNAFGITLATLFGMLLLYKTKVIQATETFRAVIFTATFGVAIFYLVLFIAMLFGHPINVFNGSPLGITISVIICIVAALNFILDFDFIDKAEEYSLPKYYEWYGGLCLMVTIVWLYLEILKLLAQLSKRN